jgi:ABC-2 type transport system permease protein
MPQSLHAHDRTPVAAAPARNTSWLAEELATIRVLVRRDLMRFFRERSRVAGALLQPLIFWLVIGSGMAPSFRALGSGEVGYLQYFFPGTVVMVVLFTAIFTTMSVIEDRHTGFLQSVLVAPGSRAAVVLGKCLGSSAVALSQAGLFVLLAPLSGHSFGDVLWLPLVSGLLLSCLALCALGFFVAWWLDSTAGYHVVMSLLLLPLWILSGAMFPLEPGSVFAALSLGNPMSYAVDVVRHALRGDAAAGFLADLSVLLAFACAAVLLAVRVCTAKR